MANVNPTTRLNYCEICGSSFPRKFVRKGIPQRFCSTKCSNRRVVVTITGLWDRIDQSSGPDECWPWRGTRDKNGYGKVKWKGHHERAHRVVYSLGHCYEDISELLVLHRCDNPPCCNPQHLFVGTVADNNEDKRLKARHSFGESINTATLSAEEVLAARRLVAEGGSLNQAANMLRQKLRSKSAAYYALKGKTWGHLPTIEQLRKK